MIYDSFSGGKLAAIIVIVIAVLLSCFAIVWCLKWRKRRESKDQTFFAFRRSHADRQQSHWYWPTYKHVISNV